MSILLFYTGLVLFIVPLILMFGFGVVIVISFMRDDSMTAGIMRVSAIIMMIGAALMVGYFVNNSLEKGKIHISSPFQPAEEQSLKGKSTSQQE